MAEQRERLGLVLLKLGSKRRGRSDRSLEVFEAMQWPDAPGAGHGLYRVRMAGRWVTANGQAHTFFTPEQLGLLLAGELTKPGMLDTLENGRPDLRKGQNVRVYPDPASRERLSDDEQTRAGSTRTRVGSDPIQCVDGQWYIIILGELVSCDLVQGLDHFGRAVEGTENR